MHRCTKNRKGTISFVDTNRARWVIEIFNGMILFLYSKTKLSYIVHVSISFSRYLQHVCSNKPLKVFGKLLDVWDLLNERIWTLGAVR